MSVELILAGMALGLGWIIIKSVVELVVLGIAAAVAWVVVK